MRSESQEFIEKRFKFLADLTQNTSMDEDNIKFIIYQEIKDMDIINSKSIQDRNSQEYLKCPENLTGPTSRTCDGLTIFLGLTNSTL